MFIKVFIQWLSSNQCRENKSVLKAIYSLNLGLWTLLKIPSKQFPSLSQAKIKEGIFIGPQIWKIVLHHTS